MIALAPGCADKECEHVSCYVEPGQGPLDNDSDVTRSAGLLHLTGMRGEDGRLSCVLCEAVMPERHRGVSQDTYVGAPFGRPPVSNVFEFCDEFARGETVVSIGLLSWRRCDVAVLDLLT